MRNRVLIAEPFTLGDFLAGSRLMGDLEIINECNETLLTLSYVEDNVCGLENTLAEELLARRILSYGVRDGRTFVRVEGVEDAE